MKFNVYSVYDTKVEEFSAPFIQREGAVIRSIEQLLKSSPVPAVDLVLYKLGEFDNETGLLSDLNNECVGKVSDLITQEVDK